MIRSMVVFLMVFCIAVSFAFEKYGFNGQEESGYGVWTSNPEDKALIATGSVVTTDKVGFSGGCFEFKYNLGSPDGGFAGFYIEFGSIDLSKYSQLVFWIKGDKKSGFSEKAVVNFSGGSQFINITPNWQKIVIGLKGFTKKNAGSEFSLTFESGWATEKKGTVYIDEVTLK
ncbi:MAG: carbohydrate binding domain-containing protein [Candidatus Kaelpia imicola]|nr:carbohydrate binding domain-containing protein [Candidatus Kaelpia imicola]